MAKCMMNGSTVYIKIPALTLSKANLGKLFIFSKPVSLSIKERQNLLPGLFMRI